MNAVLQTETVCGIRHQVNPSGYASSISESLTFVKKTCCIPEYQSADPETSPRASRASQSDADSTHDKIRHKIRLQIHATSRLGGF